MDRISRCISSSTSASASSGCGPIFVVGTPRSGTTLLAVMLGRHSAIAATPETAFYDEIAPRIEADGSDLATELKAWPRLDDLDLDPDDIVKACRDLRNPSGVLETILAAYTQRAGKSIACEKTPQHLQHAERILHDFQNCRILCMQRDGRDVALSLAAMPWWVGGLEAAAARWRHDLIMTRRLERLFPDRLMVVKYETLVADPHAAIAALMPFVGYEFEAQQLVAGGSPVVLSRSHKWKGTALLEPTASFIKHRRETCEPEELRYLRQALFDDLLSLKYEQSSPSSDGVAPNLAAWPGTAPATRKASRSPRLSACVITRDSATRLATLLGQLSTVADEVVVGVDDNSSDDTLAVAVANADVVFRFRSGLQMAPVRMLVLDYAQGDWILSVDDDELLEENFPAVLSKHLQNAAITHCWFPRKWLSRANPEAYYRFAPWFPDWQLRLFRNDRTLVYKPPRAHSGYYVQGPGIFEAQTSIIHFNHQLRSPDERARINSRYRAAGATDAALANYEASTEGPTAPAPVLLDPTPRRRRPFPLPTFVIEPPAASLPLWKAAIISADMPPSAMTNSSLVVDIVARNLGGLAWVPSHWSIRAPKVLLSYHLLDDDGNVLAWDNPRCEMPAVVRPDESAHFIMSIQVPEQPGRYCYEWDFVSEWECWFSALGSRTLRSTLVATAPSPGLMTMRPSISSMEIGVNDRQDEDEHPLAKSK